MRWILKSKPEKEKVQKLQNELQINEIIATLLVQRGIETYDQARQFFRPSLADLHNPYLMKDMDKAVSRIEKAIADGENILVFGDYDVDGTTAVSLLSSYLKSYYSNVATYIPDRYDEGYGISYKGIDFAEDNEFTLIIALDCGIKSVDHIAYANDRNIILLFVTTIVREICCQKQLLYSTQNERIAVILMTNCADVVLGLNSFKHWHKIEIKLLTIYSFISIWLRLQLLPILFRLRVKIACWLSLDWK